MHPDDHDQYPAEEAKGTSHPLIRYWYLILIGLALVSSWFVWFRYYAFTDQNYVAAQPIPYSHKLHAGDYQIPCQYCHYNAARGRHAGIPPLSVCLGCHGPDQGAVGADNENVQKLLALTVNSETGTYYRDVDDADPSSKDENLLKVGGNVHWNRIHQLPDHVYFSHEWHVGAGVSCQTCHGPIEEMEVVWQHSDLTMGWCIRCHREEDYVSYNSKRSGLHNRYDENDASTFLVGTGDYDVIRARIRPDSVVKFEERHVKGAHADHGDHGDDHGKEKAKSTNHLRGRFDDSLDNMPLEELHKLPKAKRMDYFTKEQHKALQKLFEKHEDLPRWRVADLPESHRAFYGDNHHQNAPTHCSTCHQ